MTLEPPLSARRIRLAALALAAWYAMWMPLTVSAAGVVMPWPGLAAAFGLIALAGLGIAEQQPFRVGLAAAVGLAAVLLLGALLAALARGGAGHAARGFWAAVAALWLAGWIVVDAIVAATPKNVVARTLNRVAAPLLFGVTLLILWECVVRGAGVPRVILPAPSEIAVRFGSSLPMLGVDFLQTARGVVGGYVIGCSAGLAAAILTDRLPFFQRGLLPFGNLVSALPIVGIAPIMVMWFGFDWHSKAAVVVVMTFFPMLVNCVVGLAAAAPTERDLMKTYAANYWQTLLKLRLPAALPFIFNALKINATLALIGAIVAEFFGTPIVGIGFRISTEVGRMNIDMVWATIGVAALFGSAFYWLLSLAERRVTFWHASYRARI
jgi:NitT/TauT family transport system permease protein